MHLSKLELNGFKSFAKKVVLEFPRGLTAIVGPNGSGKSNVADAVRWVLGEQSAKLLRGKRSEDVIFAGSTKKSRLSMAEVSMWLDNSDRRAPIDHSEVVLTRRVYRSGEGEYLINKKPARLQDILMLLAQSNFGQKTYSVIGQGMVESFLNSTPEQRKELFEDAAGVRQYQMKRDQSLHKLAQTRENLSRVELLLQEISPRLRSLTRQVKRLERRADVEAELRRHQVSYYATLLTGNRNEHDGVATQRDDLQRTADAATRRLKVIQQALEQLEAERSRTDAFQQLQKGYNDEIDRKNRLLEEHAVIKGKLELIAAKEGTADVVVYSREDRQRLDRLAVLEEAHTTLTAGRERTRTAIATVGQEKERLNADIRQILDATPLPVDALRQHLSGLDRAWDTHLKLATELARAEARLEAITEERDRLREERERMEREQKSQAATEPAAAQSELAKQHRELEQKVSTIDERLAQLRVELNSFNSKEQEKKERLFVLQKSFRDEQQTLNLLTSRLNEFRVQLAKIDTRREDLERELNQELPEDTREKIRTAVNAKDVDPSTNPEQRLAEIHRLKKNLELIGGIDESTEQEFHQTKERHDFLSHQAEDLAEAMEKLDGVIADLDATIKKRFDESFETISHEFSRYFRTLFSGGNAKLVLVRETVVDEPEEEGEEAEDEEEGEEPKAESRAPKAAAHRVVTGIEIQATPPGKKLKSIAMLSGGERALTSIALISAILAANPSPFVILDEVDAALDEANSHRFAKIVAHLAEKTQFITITHNRTTMEHAAVLYGVTMGDDGLSKLLSIKMADAEKVIPSYGNRG
ncbi:MAG: chromosome segregation protein SMC [Candidatus Kerfeldbacteria bacterium]|nr:chromosome segregation protein SMC [Candidatus Kerfeldbacteria bacterium]